MIFYSENCIRDDVIKYAITHQFKYVRSYAVEGKVRWTVSNSYYGSGAIEWTNDQVAMK